MRTHLYLLLNVHSKYWNLTNCLLCLWVKHSLSQSGHAVINQLWNEHVSRCLWRFTGWTSAFRNLTVNIPLYAVKWAVPSQMFTWKRLVLTVSVSVTAFGMEMHHSAVCSWVPVPQLHPSDHQLQKQTCKQSWNLTLVQPTCQPPRRPRGKTLFCC